MGRYHCSMLFPFFSAFLGQASHPLAVRVEAAIVFGEIKFLGLVIFLELVDEFDVGIPESVNALVIIPYGHDGDFCIFTGCQPAGECRNKPVLACVYVLVLIHQN